MQGFNEKKLGQVKLLFVATQKLLPLVIESAAENSLFLKMVSIKTAYIQARMNEDGPPVFVMPSVKFKKYWRAVKGSVEIKYSAV